MITYSAATRLIFRRIIQRQLITKHKLFYNHYYTQYLPWTPYKIIEPTKFVYIVYNINNRKPLQIVIEIVIVFVGKQYIYFEINEECYFMT